MEKAVLGSQLSPWAAVQGAHYPEKLEKMTGLWVAVTTSRSQHSKQLCDEYRKDALVTGGNRGIGKEIVRQLAASLQMCFRFPSPPYPSDIRA